MLCSGVAAPRLVMKFGGSSLADHAKLRAAARKVAQRHADGTQVVVVVSAMGSTTDALVSEAHEIHPTPSRRELDMLMTTGERHSMVLSLIHI